MEFYSRDLEKQGRSERKQRKTTRVKFKKELKVSNAEKKALFDGEEGKEQDIRKFIEKTSNAENETK